MSRSVFLVKAGLDLYNGKKEKHNGALIQRKATIPLQLDGQFDSHLYEGRQVQMVLSKDKVIGEHTIEVQRMADVARSASNHSSIIK